VYNVTAGSTEELFRGTIYIPFFKISLLTYKADLVISTRKLMKITCLLNPTFQDLDEDV